MADFEATDFDSVKISLASADKIRSWSRGEVKKPETDVYKRQVLDKPVIQYVVEEALDPEEVDGAIIVTSPGKPELLNYFQPDRSLESLLLSLIHIFDVGAII